MKSKLPAALLASVLALAASPAAPAQTRAPSNAQDWQGLRGLKPGKRILVELRSGAAVEGEFDGVTGDTLNLSADGNTYDLVQSDIRRVYRLKGRWSRGKAARVGAGIGMVVGTVIGVRAMVRAEQDPAHVPSADDTGPPAAGMILGTLAGAGAGALLGGRRRGELLYDGK